VRDDLLFRVATGVDTVDATLFGPVFLNASTFGSTGDSFASVTKPGPRVNLDDFEDSDLEEALLRLLLKLSSQIVRSPSFSSGCALIACLSVHQRGTVLKPSSLSFARSGISCLYKHPCCV